MLRKVLLAVAVVGAIGTGAGAASTAAADHCHYGGYYGPSYHRSSYHGHGRGYYGPSYRHVHYHGYSPYYHGHYHRHHHGYHGYHGRGGVSVSIGF